MSKRRRVIIILIGIVLIAIGLTLKALEPKGPDTIPHFRDSAMSGAEGTTHV